MEFSYSYGKPDKSLDYCTIPQMLDRRTRENPDKNAHIMYQLTDGGVVRSLATFQDLTQRSKGTASYFLHRGLKPGDRIGIIGENSLEYMYTDYACLRIKVLLVRIPANVMMMDTLIPMINRYNLKMLVLGQGKALDNFALLRKGLPENFPALLLEEKLQKHFDKLECVDFHYTGDQKEVDGIEDTCSPDDVAVMFPISGTSGVPKALLHSHLYHQSFPSASEGTGDNIFFNNRPFSWVGGTSFWPVATNATMIFLDPRISKDNELEATALKIMRDDAITQTLAMPYNLYDVRAALIKGGHYFPETLKTIYTGGEIIPPDLIQFMNDRYRNFCIIYGSTESGFAALSSDSTSTHLLSPLPHVEVKIVGEHGHILPYGEVGYLCVRSPYTLKGILEDESAFVAVRDEAGWVRTSDLTRMDQEGRIEIIGRESDTISRGTTKVLPKPMETWLLGHPEVEKAAVFGVPDPRLFQEIGAAVVVRSGCQLSAEGLRQFCEQNALSSVSSSVPKYFLFLEKFEVGATGKVQKDKLADLVIERFNLSPK